MRIKEWLAIGIMTGLLAGLGLQVCAQGPGFQLEGIGSASVPVTVNKMTNIIFPEAIQTGVKVSRDVIAQKVRGVENVLELKAVRPGFQPTNLSVYGKDGRLYSFLLQYADSGVLNFRVLPLAGAVPVLLSGLPADLVTLRTDGKRLAGKKPFLNVSAQTQGMKLRLAGLYLRDSLEWVVLELSNRSQIPFRPGYARFFVQDRKQVKRKAVQEVAVAPVYSGMPADVSGRGRVRFALGFNPFTVPGDKRLMVEMAGVDGRTVVMGVKAKFLLKAKAD
jgi:conjugative transposon TraN protein